MNHFDALKACKADLSEVGGGISGLTWRLPSISEYIDAETDGIRSALPDMDYLWWSSSVSSYYEGHVWVFYDGYVGHHSNRNSYQYVRCVAK